MQLAAGRGLTVLAVAGYGDQASLGAKGVLPRVAPDVLAGRVRELTPAGADGVLDAPLLGQPLVDAVRDGGRS